MILLGMELKLRLYDIYSLKDKRKIVKSIIDKVHHHYKISAAEVAKQDSTNEAVIGLAVVSGQRKQAESLLSKVEDMIEQDYPLEIVSRYGYEGYDL